MQALGHRPHAEQYVFTRMLENWADNFLALDAEMLDALAEMDCSRGGRTSFSFHQARGLLKIPLRVNRWLGLCKEYSLRGARDLGHAQSKVSVNIIFS
jgi:hypothetical protein